MLRSVAMTLVSCMSLGCGRPALETPEAKEVAVMTAFQCADAPRWFGVQSPAAGAPVVVEQCAEYLPGFVRAVMSGGALPHATVFRGVWLEGERLDGQGLAAFARWAAAAKLHQVERFDAWQVGQLLEVLGAFPAQFDGESLASVRDPVTGEAGSVTARPFSVTAWRNGYVPPAAVTGPARAATDDGPAPAAPAAPAGPLGGYQPSFVARARLTGDAEYRFRWDVAWRGPDGTWHTVEQ